MAAKFKVLTIGWEPDFINRLLMPVQQKTEMEFVHGLVGNADRLVSVKERHPDMMVVSISQQKNLKLPDPDYKYLAELESAGGPTLKAMIQGDRVLRYRTDNESFGYATLLGQQIEKQVDELNPDVMLASFDSLHSSLSYLIAKARNIPWVAMTFPVIPDDLTGFCDGLTPNCIVPMGREIRPEIRARAIEVLKNFQLDQQAVVAFRAPSSIGQWLLQLRLYAINFSRRVLDTSYLGVDRYTYPTILERVRDILRRIYNRVMLPSKFMLRVPPNSKYAYFPLHMAPESTVDTWAPFYQDQLAIAAQVLLALPADTQLVVKIHFSDPDNYNRRRLLELLKMPGMHIAHPSSSGRAFLEQASLIVGIQGTSCLEGALLGKPVLLFGDSPYGSFPRTEMAELFQWLPEQIRKLMAKSPPLENEIVESLANYMARYLPGKVNDWSCEIDKNSIELYAAAFLELRSYIESSCVGGDYQ